MVDRVFKANSFGAGTVWVREHEIRARVRADLDDVVVNGELLPLSGLAITTSRSFFTTRRGRGASSVNRGGNPPRVQPNTRGNLPRAALRRSSA
jgi:hypothetical protein